jgi:acetyltransferase-like isoleucine patch superfamily enzyme
LINIIHSPREGTFKRSLRNKDFFFFLLRRNLKSYVLRIYNYFPLPWAKLLALKVFNIKICYNAGVLDSFIDSDFIEIGKNTILGEGSIIMSSMILGNDLIVKKVILKNGCTIGAFSVVTPGTIVEEGAILGMGSYTNPNQVLEKNFIHLGRPARKWKMIENTFE